MYTVIRYIVATVMTRAPKHFEALTILGLGIWAVLL